MCIDKNQLSPLCSDVISLVFHSAFDIPVIKIPDNLVENSAWKFSNLGLDDGQSAIVERDDDGLTIVSHDTKEWVTT